MPMSVLWLEECSQYWYARSLRIHANAAAAYFHDRRMDCPKSISCLPAAHSQWVQFAEPSPSESVGTGRDSGRANNIIVTSNIASTCTTLHCTKSDGGEGLSSNRAIIEQARTTRAGYISIMCRHIPSRSRTLQYSLSYIHNGLLTISLGFTACFVASSARCLGY